MKTFCFTFNSQFTYFPFNSYFPFQICYVLAAVEVLYSHFYFKCLKYDMFLLLATEAMCINTELQIKSFVLIAVVWYSLTDTKYTFLICICQTLF